MRRREVITLLGSAAAAWPLAARAQQSAVPVIGFLNGQSPTESESRLAAFRQGLNETGYVEHRNVGIEYRWAGGRYERLPAFAADLVNRQVSVIVASGGDAAALAAKEATASIPIVFTTGGDSVKLGLVASFNRPGGNVTGVSFFTNELGSKRLQLLHELVPAATAIGFLVNPTRPFSQFETSDVQAAARVLGLQLHVENASNDRDIDAAFASFVQQRVNALFVGADAFFVNPLMLVQSASACHHGKLVRSVIPMILLVTDDERASNAFSKERYDDVHQSHDRSCSSYRPRRCCYGAGDWRKFEGPRGPVGTISNSGAGLHQELRALG